MKLSIKELMDAYKRRQLMKSAQRKLASGQSLTADEINALAYYPLRDAMRSIREHCPFRSE